MTTPNSKWNAVTTRNTSFALLRVVPLLVFCVLLFGGCVSRQDAAEQAKRAYDAGVQQGLRMAESKRTQVTFRGPFQSVMIPWRPGLTLSQAIVEAVYTSPNDPRVIVVMRAGEPNYVDPKDLLNRIDFHLEAGDEVVVQP